jgi:5'-nucleotidase
MKILVSNDDGWFADGLIALAEQMRNIGEVRVVAPDRNCSAASSALTLTHPIRVTQQSSDVYSVHGTPADCVLVALNGMMDWVPDLVVSGINNGPNLGDDVIYSGTVAAAFEGRQIGKPSIAFSLSGDGAFDYEGAAITAREVVEHMLANPLPDNTILNVNIPSCARAEIAGWRATRLGRRTRSQQLIEQRDPRGQTVYWIGGVGEAEDDAPDTDFHAIHNNYVSLTPLDIDMSHHRQLSTIENWLGGRQA